MPYTVAFSSLAARQLKKLSRPFQEQVASIVKMLANDPRPRGSIKLSGRPEYRVRSGNLRVLYLIDDGALIVEIMTVADRKESY
ncbi:MAG: type II toxin-antitoxin system RelE family toxin [Acidobacteriota bacterium]